MASLLLSFHDLLAKHSYNPNVQQHYLSSKLAALSDSNSTGSSLNDPVSNFNLLSLSTIEEIEGAEKLIHDITKCAKGASMLTNFQNEVEAISSRAKRMLANAQKLIDRMKLDLPKLFPNTRSSGSERQCALGKVECLTFRIVTATKLFKAALKSSWKNIKYIEERKKRLNYAGSLPKAAVKKPGEYTTIPTMDPDGDSGYNRQENIQIVKESVKLDSILSSLYEISTIFNKIGEMAELQRIMVERIDQYTEEALQNVEKGKSELVLALTYQADTRALMLKPVSYTHLTLPTTPYV
eukprot:TRINITY_DN2164_c0_g1_i6.p1 TRINITY_DN2164_c0_g1~~TRINITY_DN2164_c0_g1_i6.p1  ORF type:complete len:296 (+),score=90.65 TRINITY_DN2164_c0_g1_i6:140-1027(+)